MEPSRSGVRGMDASQVLMGHGWPVGASTRERWRKEGTRSAAEGRMSGQGVLPTFVPFKSGSP